MHSITFSLCFAYLLLISSVPSPQMVTFANLHAARSKFETQRSRLRGFSGTQDYCPESAMGSQIENQPKDIFDLTRRGGRGTLHVR
jgi:hypothetical protein